MLLSWASTPAWRQAPARLCLSPLEKVVVLGASNIATHGVLSRIWTECKLFRDETDGFEIGRARNTLCGTIAVKQGLAHGDWREGPDGGLRLEVG